MKVRGFSRTASYSCKSAETGVVHSVSAHSHTPLAADADSSIERFVELSDLLVDAAVQRLILRKTYLDEFEVLSHGDPLLWLPERRCVLGGRPRALRTSAADACSKGHSGRPS